MLITFDYCNFFWFVFIKDTRKKTIFAKPTLGNATVGDRIHQPKPRRMGQKTKNIRKEIEKELETWNKKRRLEKIEKLKEKMEER